MAKPAEGTAAEEAGESAAYEKTEDETAEKPYGNVNYADPGYQPDGQKRYPLDTEKHVRAAASYFGRSANRAKYTAAQQAHIDKAIKAAEKKFGIDPGDYRQVITAHS